MASPTRVSGMMSGIDTESVVQAYVQTYVAKKNKVQQAQTKLSYKQDAWKTLNTKVYSLYSKIGGLRFTSSYNLKKTTVSDATKASVTASSNAVVGSQTLNIKNLAKAGYLTGAQLSKGTTENTTLSSLGFDEGDTTISVRVGGGDEKEITLNGNSKISDVLDSLKQAGVNASYDANNRRIFVSAKESGASNDFAITASSAGGNKALDALGLLTSAAADVKGYAANAAFAVNTEGQSYYVLDSDGNITYDEDGNAVTNGTYDADKTKQNITDTLTNLANAYNRKSTLTAENTLLRSKIEYSNAKDAVDNMRSSGADGSSLVDLINAQAEGKAFVDADGNTYATQEEAGEGVEVTAIGDKINELAKSVGLITTETDDEGVETDNRSKLDEFIKSNSAFNKYASTDTSDYYLSEAERESSQSTIDANNTQMSDDNKYIAANSYWDKKDYSSYYDENGTLDISNLASSIASKIDYAKKITSGDITIEASSGATRVTGEDSEIILNGARYTSSSNNYSINGLNINALAKTDGDITISTTQDNQGIYDKVKEFLSQYNELINEMQSLYNADSAKGYEPLTEDQKDEMSDKEIEKWEDKIKDAILRRDSSLGTLINKMTSTMSKPIQINGRGYSLSDFGIQTLGFLNASKNEQYAYHIYGDEDDSTVSGREDKLMAMINSDPEAVTDFMRQLSANLYDAIGGEMKSSNLRSAYTAYNDKQMTKDYNSYTKSIKEWETKIAAMEDRYYKRFSAMESALAKMQSATSSLSTLLGN